jgi:hypothetical protein
VIESCPFKFTSSDNEDDSARGCGMSGGLGMQCVTEDNCPVFQTYVNTYRENLCRNKDGKKEK